MSIRINYNNNPILKWNLSNVVVKIDDNENIMLSKEKSRQRMVENQEIEKSPFGLFC